MPALEVRTEGKAKENYSCIKTVDKFKQKSITETKSFRVQPEQTSRKGMSDKISAGLRARKNKIEQKEPDREEYLQE